MDIMGLVREIYIIKKNTKHINSDMLEALNFVSNAFCIIIITNRI
jgi:hypothetical protein